MGKLITAGGIVLLAAAAQAVRLSGTAAAPTGLEWEQEQNLSYNREPARAWAFSFTDTESAKKILPRFSSRWRSLDSRTEWKFKWSKDPDSRPKGFQDPAFDVSGWETIVVPCSWQAMGARPGCKGGWGSPLYCNQPYPFRRAWPTVMGEPPKNYTNYKARNPVGSYRRDFTVPAEWAGEEVYLQFDGVDSFFYLWVNGRYVGFSKDSRTPAAFRITPYLKAGRNVAAVEVYRYSDASYLECQDMTRLSGIFRTVQLCAVPKLHIRDFFTHVEPLSWKAMQQGRGDWEVVVDVEMENLSAPGAAAEGVVVAKVYDAAGDEVAPAAPKDPPWDGSRGGASKPFNLIGQRSWKTGIKLRFANPKQWSAETPNLYTLVLELRDGRGRLLEAVPSQLGFRKVEIAARDGQTVKRFWVNGQKIKLKGVNRHEADPMTGHYVSDALVETDVRMLKEANINHVRCSHYPASPYFYYACNKYGIYVMDEANIESHGYYYGKESLSHPVEWMDATVARVMDMVERDKNHPCVVSWSLGNEAGPGRNFAVAERTLKARDTSRPTQYERNNSIVDMGSNQYPSVPGVRHKAGQTGDPRPFYISEYAHNMMNALGDFSYYQDAIELSDVILGGSIWDWVDQALWYDSPVSGKRILAYGGDWNDVPNSGQFVCNGTILADRTPEPGYFEVAHVYRNIKAEQKDGRILITNKNYFRPLDYVTARWTLLKNGAPSGASGVFDVSRIGPQKSAAFDLPAAAAAAAPRSPDGFDLRIEFLLKQDEPPLKKGFAVASDQIALRPPAPVRIATAAAGPALDVRETAAGLAVSGRGFSAFFSKKDGSLARYALAGKELLLEPVKLDAFRCPSSNETRQGRDWAALGLRDLTAVSAALTDVRRGPGGTVSFRTTATVQGRRLERLVDFDGMGPTRLEPVDSPKRALRFIVNAAWKVYPDGSVSMQSAILPRGTAAELPRLGCSLVLDGALDRVEYLARGPFENYPDRKSGAFPGRWAATVADMVVNYARPNDMGNREDARWVKVAAGDGRGLLVCAMNDSSFAFSALPYTATDLLLAKHWAELPESRRTVLTLLCVNRGLGGASCGPGPLFEHIPRANKPYRLNLVFRPASAAADPAPVAEDPVPLDESMAAENEPLRAVACTSQEPGNEGQKVCDGDPGTFWHSQYGVTMGKFPHAVTIDLLKPRTLKGIVCLGRQDANDNGRVKAYSVEVSPDNKRWTTVKEGELTGSKKPARLLFARPAPGVRYLRFTALSELSGREFASMAEISVF